MNNETTIWDQIPNNEEELNGNNEVREFVLWGGHPQHTLTFENNKVTSGVNKYNRQAYYFEVVENGVKKILSVTSVRLMIKLKALGPLAGQTVTIVRKGEGYETEYEILW